MKTCTSEKVSSHLSQEWNRVRKKVLRNGLFLNPHTAGCCQLSLQQLEVELQLQSVSLLN